MNISGEFALNLAGQDRVLKATFSAIEAIERQTGKSVIALLASLAGGNIISMGELVTVIHVGLNANKDTRLTRAEIGEAIIAEGNFDKAMAACADFLAYVVTGGKEKRKENTLGEA